MSEPSKHYYQVFVCFEDECYPAACYYAGFKPASGWWYMDFDDAGIHYAIAMANAFRKPE